MKAAPHILILDNSPRRLGTYWFGKWFKQLGCKVSAYDFWRKPRRVKLDKFDALVVSGSPASATEDTPLVLSEVELVRQADQQGMPVLGVCFGSQLLGRAYYGKEAIRSSLRPEIGWYTICRNETTDLLLQDVPPEFTSFQYHTEEVLPQPDMQILAASNHTQVQAFRVEDKPIWGTQFHFEVTPRAGLDLLRKTRRFYEPFGFDYEAMIARVQSSPVPKQLFHNFLNSL
jgi:GMP synthase (glutamine-hydrolysing)